MELGDPPLDTQEEVCKVALEKSMFELAVDDLLELQRLTRLELRARFKGTKPFRMEEIPADEMLYEYNTMTPEKLNAMVETYGRDDVNQYIMEMEQLKRKRGGEVNA